MFSPFLVTYLKNRSHSSYGVGLDPGFGLGEKPSFPLKHNLRQTCECLSSCAGPRASEQKSMAGRIMIIIRQNLGRMDNDYQ